MLVNNAGIVSGKKFYDVPDKLADLTFQVNTIAHLWVREVKQYSVTDSDTGQDHDSSGAVQGLGSERTL